MAVSIQIVVDDGQNVHVVEAGNDLGPAQLMALVRILEEWKRQADEPCSAGKRCKILQQWISQIEDLLK